MAFAAGLTWASFRGKGRFQFGIRTLFAAVTGGSLVFACLQYVGEQQMWLSLLFLVVAVPMANLLTIAALGLVALRWKQRGLTMETPEEVEPYLGPVTQKPVDVQRGPKPGVNSVWLPRKRK